MSRQIQVEVQGDHLDKVSKSSPLTSVTELVWNALDADASVVDVSVESGDMGITAIRMKDDGHGIDYKKAATLYKGLGGSWQRRQGRFKSGLKHGGANQ